MAQKGVILQIELLPCVNLSMIDYHAVVCNRCALTNMSDHDVQDVEVTVSGEFITTSSVTVAQLSSQWTVQLGGLQVEFNREMLAELNQPIVTTAHFAATSGQDILTEKDCEVTLLPDNYWPGLQVMPSAIATLVHPESTAVAQILHAASQHLERITQDPVFDNYQTQDPNRSRAQMAAIYQTMQQLQITTMPIDGTLEQFRNRVRSHRQVLDQRLGNSLEIALLMVACLEACGLNPLIVFMRSHVLVGTWLVDSFSPSPVSDDSSFLIKASHDDLGEMALLDVATCGQTEMLTFDQASQRAQVYIRDTKQAFNCYVDIKACRLQNIRPSASTSCEDSPTQDAVNNDTIKSISPIDIARQPTGEITKQQIWERKLLDFSMRNNLLNMRIGKRVLPFISFAIDQLEDHISKGEEYSILPSPAQSRFLPDEHGIYDSTLVQEQWQPLVVNELKNKRLRCYLSDTETVNVLKHIHRTSRVALEENGANSLFLALGILKWYETDRSIKPRYAPILMIPVDLIRHAGSNYVIRSRGEETIINVTLVEMIKQQFQLTMPGLSPLPTDSDGVDVRQVMAIVRNAIISRPRWDVLDEAMLGLFSFSKFVMWNDIHNHALQLSRHPVIQALADGKALNPDDTEQADVDARELDQQSSPAEFAIPVDVDSSQFEAIVESGMGKSFVLHGPPGTGKSQTITNMIANALFQGKRVLFVAEKMAALEVVQKRIKAIGFNPFCLELHSNKATKTHVLQQLDLALNTIERGASKDYPSTAKKLFQQRKQLAQYVQAMHEQRSYGMSLYECLSRYLDTEGDEMQLSHRDINTINADVIAQSQEAILALEPVLQLTGTPSHHPLYGLAIHDTTPQGLRHTGELIKRYGSQLAQLRQDAAGIDRLLALDLGNRLPSYHVLSELSRSLADIRWLSVAMMDCGNPTRLQHWQQLIALGAQRSAAKAQVDVNFNPTAYQLNAAELKLQWQTINQKWWLPKYFAKRKFLKLFSPHLRVINNKGEHTEHLLTLLEDFQQKDANYADPMHRELEMVFAQRLSRDAAPWAQMHDDLQRAARLIGQMDQYATSEQKALILNTIGRMAATNPGAFASNGAVFKQMCHDYGQASNTLAEMKPFCSFDNPDNEHLEELANTLSQHVEHEGREWKLWTDQRDHLRTMGLGEVVDAITHGLEPSVAAIAWAKAVYHHIASDTLASDQRLESFSGLVFEDTIKKFRQLDNKFQELTKNELFNRLTRSLREHTMSPKLFQQMGYLRRNINNRGRGQSVRNIMDQISDLLPYLCPCLLMSPISVAQYLDLSQPPFDIVIFDEASQMPTSEAVGAIARGKALIVVGDPKQMPPTSFFNVNQVDESEAVIDDLDSVLDDTIALDFPARHLRWHYRSRHESLIAFSNSQYYDGRLITFPSVDDRDTKVSFIPVQGVYDYGRTRSNKAEAQAIVEEVLRRLSDKELRKMSLGIVSFSVAQQNLIDDLLMDAFALYPKLEQFATDREEPLFIKNLENVQGDERDVILFSIGYGPDARGKVSMNFGPLNNSGGERRLNVAVSRARYEMIVFSTLQPEQIDLNRSKSLGVQGLKMFLEYARDGHISYQNNNQQHVVNIMAKQLAQELSDKGYQVDTAVGRSKFKIDLAVINPHEPDKYMLGILCDGKGYSDTKTVRDREVCQPTVLTALGWNIVRIWMVDWFYHRQRVVDQVLEKLRNIEAKLTAQNSKADVHKQSNISQASTEQPAQLKQETPSSLDKQPVSAKLPSLPTVTHKPAAEPEPAASEPVVASIEPKPDRKTLPKAKPKRDDADVQPSDPQHEQSTTAATPVQYVPQLMPYVEADIQVEEKGGVMMMTTRPTKTMAQMTEILKCEQPITFHYACKRMCRIWAIRSINDRVQRYVTWLLKQTATLDDAATQAVPYYWAKNKPLLNYAGYRVKAGREWNDIPLIEIENAILALLIKGKHISEAEMPQRVIETFGIKKCGTLFHEQVSHALTELVRQKRIRHDSNGYSNSRKSKATSGSQ